MTVSDPSSTINYSRDSLGRVTTIANTYGTSPNSIFNTTLTQSFDSVGNRTELRAAIGSNLDFKNSYTYDKLRRLTDIVQAGQTGGNAVAAKHVSFNYNALSQLTKISRYQSTGTTNPVATTDFTFDTANRLSGISHKQGATNLNTYAYTYDRMSRLSTVNSTAEGLTSYSYDQVSQLIGATNTIGNDETYDYDANGNRKTGYTVDTDNRTTASPSAPSTPAYNYLYDDEGNITRRLNPATLAATYYEYDHRNRLVTVSSSQSRIDYQYDAYNRLVSRKDLASFTYWAYDTGINPVLELDSSKNPVLTHRYLWSNSVDELLADESVTSTSSGGNTLWGLADHLGTIRDIADANEATGVTSVVNHRRYNGFGKLMSQTGAANIIFGYTGKYSDAATGLQNNLNRWYDPNLGKWSSQDPIGFAGGDANLYRYVGNSPTNATDPNGLETWWEKIFGRSNSLGDPYMDQYAATLVPELGIRSSGGMSTEIAFADPIWDERRKTFSWSTWVDPEYMTDLWYQEGSDYVWGRERAVESRRMTDPNRPLGGSIGPIGPLRGPSAAKALSSVGTAPIGGTAIKDLKPIQGSAHTAPRPYLQKLTDDELLNSARNPLNGDGLTRSTRDGILRDGNGRAIELQRRALDPNSKISPNDLVPVKDYTPDLSMFPDLD